MKRKRTGNRRSNPERPRDPRDKFRALRMDPARVQRVRSAFEGWLRSVESFAVRYRPLLSKGIGEGRATVGFLCALVLLVIITAASRYSLRNTRELDYSAAHAQQVILGLQRTLLFIQDVESGQRGYVATGNPSFTVSIEDYGHRIDHELDDLRLLLKDRPEQTFSLNELQLLLNRRIAWAHENFAMARSRGVEVAAEQENAGGGRSLTEAIRKSITEMGNREQTWRDNQKKKADSANGRTLLVILGGSLLLFLLVAGLTVSLYKDLQLRQKAETSLRRSEESLSTTLRSIGDAVIATDHFGNVTYMNPVAESLTGWTDSHPAGKHLDEVFRIVDEITHAPMNSPFSRMAREGAPVEVEGQTVLLSRDGREIPIDHSCAPIRDSSGNLMGGVLVFRDVIARRDAERARAAHEAEIQALNQRLRRGMAETHHRVKNNLQVIAALVGMQRQEAGDTVPVAALERIEQHVRTLAGIHDLLTTESRSVGDVERVSARSVLQKLIPMIQATLGPRKLTYEVDDFVLPVRQGASLSILVNELISNAVKHGEGDVELTLSVRGAAALLEVADDGKGFPQGFDPEILGNTGMDLIASVGEWDLQGSIRFQNRPGGGAKVGVLFPVCEQDPHASESPATVVRPMPGGRLESNSV